MQCNEFEKLIPDFIHKKIDYRTMKEFDEHMHFCGDCKEELVIQFLVAEGIQRLEEGGAFDLQKELDERLAVERHKVRLHTGFMRVGILLEVLAVLAFLGIILWLVF